MLTRKRATLAAVFMTFAPAAAYACDMDYRQGQPVTVTPRADKDKDGDPYNGPGIVIDTPRNFGCVYVVQPRNDGKNPVIIPSNRLTAGD